MRRKEKRTEAFQQALVRCHSWLEGVEASQKLEDLQAAIQDCIAETAEADSMEVKPLGRFSSILVTNHTEG